MLDLSMLFEVDKEKLDLHEPNKDGLAPSKLIEANENGLTIRKLFAMNKDRH